MHSWPAILAEQSGDVRHRGAAAVVAWIEQEQMKVSAGHLLLGYMGRVLEGEMTTDIEEWRDVFMQTYQLMLVLAPGVVGLEQALRAVIVDLRSGA